jgi:hypothetical protein
MTTADISPTNSANRLTIPHDSHVSIANAFAASPRTRALVRSPNRRDPAQGEGLSESAASYLDPRGSGPVTTVTGVNLEFECGGLMPSLLGTSSRKATSETCTAGEQVRRVRNKRTLQLATLAMIILTLTPAFAVSEGTKDAKALDIVRRSLAAMRGTQVTAVSDSKVQGTITIFGDPNQTFPITMTTLGTHKLRSEIERPSSREVIILNEGNGGIIRPNAKFQQLSYKNTIGERALHLPVVSLLAECDDQISSVKFVKHTSDHGIDTDVVEIGTTKSTDDAVAQTERGWSKATFTIASASGLVISMQYMSYGEGNPTETGSLVKVSYTDYRQVNGVAIPFRVSMESDGTPDSELQVSSVSINAGVQSQDFDMAEVTDEK